jgi:hypothetical protein
MRSRRVLFIIAVAGIAIPAAAGTITVTTTDPAVAVDGECSLIEAIDNANTDAQTHADCPAGSGADVIELASSATYVLDQVVVNYYGPIGLPYASSEITVQGHDSTIERAPGADPFRLLGVSPVGTLRLVDLTLRGGEAPGSWFGGALHNYRGQVQLTRATVTENTAQGGGGLYNHSGMMTLTDCEVSLNVAVGGGGGIASGAVDADATLLVDGSSVSGNNVVDGGGGAIWVYHNGAFTSDLDVIRSTITGNTAGRTTGGIRSQGARVDIDDSTIDGNQAAWACGGLFLEGGTCEISRTTISNNIVDNTIDYGTGGGLCMDGSSAAIVNSTISGNQVLGPTSGQLYSGRGGGISLIGSGADTVLVVENSTVCDNTAELVGGGISVYRGGTTGAVELELRNTVVAENLEGGGAVLGNCVAEAPAIITSADYNLADDATCNLIAGNDLVVADAQVSALADHGGPTWTHAPENGSPVIDSGDDALCPATDQRGAPRPLDGDGDQIASCDRGSVEYGVLFMDGFESGDVSRWSASVP